MGWNDRAAEASVVLRHGGTIPEDATREALIEWFVNSADGWASGPPRELFEAIRDANPDIYRRVCSGDLPGLYDAEERDR